MSDDNDVCRLTDNGTLQFYCAGCDKCHYVCVNVLDERSWGWNGDKLVPTVTPSIKVDYWHMSAEGRAKSALFKAQHGRHATHDEIPYDLHDVCHSFIRDGVIQYLSDCTHRLANNTLPLLPYGQWYNQDA